MLLPLILLASSAVGIVTTAGCSAIFIIDTTRAASVSGLADLGPQHTICYNTASSFNSNLVAANAGDFGGYKRWGSLRSALPTRRHGSRAGP